jgi:hypothetical protein
MLGEDPSLGMLGEDPSSRVVAMCDMDANNPSDKDVSVDLLEESQ